jgi:hypothetical protein
MVVDRAVLQDATTRWKQNTVNANVIQEHQRINIVFTHFDTNIHSDREILALTETELGLTYDDPPIWKPIEGPLDLSKQQILASTSNMDDLLLGYLQQIMLNVDQMSCTISMMPPSADDELVLCVRVELTRFGRFFGAQSFPLELEHLMQAKGINMLVRTLPRQQWYKSLLKTGVFALWFRSEAGKEKYPSLPQSERPFLVVQEVDHRKECEPWPPLTGDCTSDQGSADLPPAVSLHAGPRGMPTRSM